MSTFNINADLVPLFHGLVTGLQPFTYAQQVSLCFTAEAQQLYAYYNLAEVLSEITLFLSRITIVPLQSDFGKGFTHIKVKVSKYLKIT